MDFSKMSAKPSQHLGLVQLTLMRNKNIKNNTQTAKRYLANTFMCHFEEEWVLNYTGRPSIWFRYVDDTFTLFDSENNALQFLQYFKSCHVNIKFTS